MLATAKRQAARYGEQIAGLINVGNLEGHKAIRKAWMAFLTQFAPATKLLPTREEIETLSAVHWEYYKAYWRNLDPALK